MSTFAVTDDDNRTNYSQDDKRDNCLPSSVQCFSINMITTPPKQSIRIFHSIYRFSRALIESSSYFNTTSTISLMLVNYFSPRLENKPISTLSKKICRSMEGKKHRLCVKDPNISQLVVNVSVKKLSLLKRSLCGI